MLSKIFIIFFVLLGFFYIFFYQKKFQEEKDFNPEISYNLVKNGAILLDVRTRQEYSKGFIKGAINISHTEIEKNKKKLENLTSGDKAKEIVLYCQSGRRSNLAKQKLKNLGYKNVTNHGGIESWKKD